MTATGTHSGVRVAVCAIAFAVLFASTVGIAAAGGTTDIGVTAERDALTPGGTTTVDVIVEDADGGVGALNATVTLSNPDALSVERVTIHGDPGLERVTERADGVRLSAALADTDDVGSVTVATVVLRAEAAGQTAVDVDVRTLGDEGGVAYSLRTVDRPTITVNDASGSSSDVQPSSEPTDGEAPADSGDRNTDESDVQPSSEPTDGEAPADSGDRNTDNDNDATSGENRGDSAAAAPAEQSVDAFGSLLDVIFSPVGAIGAIVFIVGVSVLRWLR